MTHKDPDEPCGSICLTVVLVGLKLRRDTNLVRPETPEPSICHVRGEFGLTAAQRHAMGVGFGILDDAGHTLSCDEESTIEGPPHMLGKSTRRIVRTTEGRPWPIDKHIEPTVMIIFNHDGAIKAIIVVAERRPALRQHCTLVDRLIKVLPRGLERRFGHVHGITG